MPATASAPRPRRRPGAFATLAATVGGNLYLVFGTFVFASACLAVALVRPRAGAYYRMAAAWARGVCRASGLALEVERPAATPGAAHAIYMANHQSLFDITVLLATLPGETRFLAKSSLFHIPIFGWAMRAGGFIPVDRRDRSSARESFASAIERLGEGISVLIFPEETRSLDGRVLPFQRGGFLLALKSALPIVPVGIDGTLEAQHRRSFLIRPGRVRVRYGEPVTLAGVSVRELPRLAEEVRRRVAALAGAELAPDEPDAGRTRAARRAAAGKDGEGA
jgi:1-acyl-sn-glycerol-3-phosphate acyltransferase